LEPLGWGKRAKEKQTRENKKCFAIVGGEGGGEDSQENQQKT